MQMRESTETEQSSGSARRLPVKSIAIVAFPGVQALDVVGPMDVFAEANSFLAQEVRYDVQIIGPSGGGFKASNGMKLIADLSYSDVGRYDLTLVAGGPELPFTMPEPGVLDFLRRQAASSRIYGSVCTGAFALGHCGLLDGKRVTTHWQDADRLARMFPDALVEPDRIHIADGQLITSAGVTAGIDLALEIVSTDHGHHIARSVAKRLVVVAHRQGGQSQFSPYLNAVVAKGSSFAMLGAFVMNNIEKRLSVADLANAVGMSPRSFARGFVEAIGHTPADFVEQARLDVARNHLEATDLPLKTIAFKCGFGASKTMHRAFVRRLGLSPQQYRKAFGISSPTQS